MGTWYDRLTEVADLNYDDSDEEANYTAALEQLQDCRDLAASFRAEPGMSGETAAAALAWLSEYEKTLEAKATELDTMHSRQQLARQAMVTARNEHADLSPQLVSPYEASAIIHSGPFELPDGTEVSGATYLNQLRHERDLERDRKAREILRTMNAAVSVQDKNLAVKLPESNPPVGDDPSGSRNTPTAPSPRFTPPRTPAPHLVTPTLPTVPSVPPVTETPSTPPPAPTTPAPTTPRPTTPIAHTPITVPNGPVTGTYTPPSVLNAHDPAWSSSYRGPGATGADAAVVVGGVLGMGASVVAARALGAGMSGSAALAYQSAAGSGNALGLNGSSSATASMRAPGGGMLASPASQAGAAQAQAAGGANAARTGRTTGGVLSRSDGSGAAGAAGTGGRATSGLGSDSRTTNRAPGLGNDSRTGKKKRRERVGLVGYDVERLDDEGAPVDTDHPALAAGSAVDVGPLASADDGERW